MFKFNPVFSFLHIPLTMIKDLIGFEGFKGFLIRPLQYSYAYPDKLPSCFCFFKSQSWFNV